MTKGLNLTFLAPHQWFDKYHDYGNCMWFPPPAAVDAAVDLLNKARHKWPELLHLVVVPRLMPGRWRRTLTRTSDVYFRMDWEDCWPLLVHYEPLLCVSFAYQPLLLHPNSGAKKVCHQLVTIKSGVFRANFARGEEPSP